VPTCMVPLAGPLVRVCPPYAHPLFYLWYLTTTTYL
jgi:hypothetical protein